MTTTATATDTGAADAAGKAVADSQAATDASAKAAADKVAADAAAAEAAKTPEQKAADAKAATDKAAADNVAADAAAEAAKNAGVPAKYELTLPDNAGVDTAIVEKTATIARELGLSNDNAQKTLSFVAQEVAAGVATQLAAWEPPSETNKEGGTKWREQEEGWRASSLADKDLGNGKPEQLQSHVTLATKVVAKFGDKDLAAFFEQSGLGSNPATLRFLSKIGKAMSEGSLVIGEPSTTPQNSEEAIAARRYTHPTSQKK